MFYFGSITLWYVMFGTVLATISASCVGTLTLLQKKPLAGDAIAHALLPGLCIGFMLAGEKLLLPLLIGAFITGFLAFWLIDIIPEQSKVKEDSATALVLSLFFGIGLLGLTYLQRGGNAKQVGLSQFLFGNAASLQAEDVRVFSCLAAVLLAILFIFFRGLKLLIFDRSFAITIGYPVRWLDMLLRVMVVVAVVVGIQSIGLVLMTAMLITPATAARFWTDRLLSMLAIAALFATLSSVGGTVWSYQVTRLPTGPCIVLTMAAIAFFSFLVAPKRGVLARMWEQSQYRKKVLQENVLKLFVKLEKKDGAACKILSLETLLAHFHLPKRKMMGFLARLSREGFLKRVKGQGWALTNKGRKEGEEIERLHLLWEAYMMHYLHIEADHVHEDAESMEHLLTPTLRKELEVLIKSTQRDGRLSG
ncbi:MAG: metal ABC transporter permease [Bacteroidota bacterium]